MERKESKSIKVSFSIFLLVFLRFLFGERERAKEKVRFVSFFFFFSVLESALNAGA